MMRQQELDFDSPSTYRIKVKGYLDDSWSDRLAGMTITSKSSRGQPPVTMLTGELLDQTELAGVLSTLYDLGYPLQSVEKVKPQEGHDVKGQKT